MKILLIEDDLDITELVEFNLKRERMTVDICHNGMIGLKQAARTTPDLIILDLMLPDMGGLDICRQLKREPKTSTIPIIMLTAKSEEVDRIVGLEVGADDYMTKPFSPRELILRIKAILRRSKAGECSPYDGKRVTFGCLTMEPDKFQVSVNKKSVSLTAIEFKLLHYLLSTKGRVATRDQLLDQVWGYEAALTTRTVDTHIKRLRQKMNQAGDYIETIRGIGYRFRERAE